MHTTDIGQRTEAIILAELVKRNLPVLLPFGSNHRYDLVVDDRGKFIRVQAKTASLSEGKISFNAQSIHAHRGKPCRAYDDEADLFGVYCPSNDMIYWIPVVEGMSAKPYLRVDPPANGQVKGVRWAKDYVACPFGDNGSTQPW